jgi:hypothetical protein
MTERSAHIIAEIKGGIAQLNKLGKKKNGLFINRTRRRSKLRKDQLNLLLDLLEMEDVEFNELWNKNMDLLKGEDLIFSSITTNRNVLHGHPSLLVGKMDKNGKLVADGRGRKIPKMTKYTHAKIYSGKIDALGRMNLRATSTKTTIMGYVLPRIYVAYIEADGEIVLKIWKKDDKIFRSTSVGRLVCNPFGKDKARRDKFLSNKDKIMRKAAQRLKALEDQLDKL